MNIYKFELKNLSKSVLIWILVLVGFMYLFMAIYPTFAADQEVIDKMMANYPEEMLKAFGMNTALPLSSVLGYMVFIFGFMHLFFAIQASNYGFSLLSVEERDLTADFLMSKPVSRQHIILSKFLAVLTALLVTNGVFVGATIGIIELFKGGHEYDVNRVLLFLSTIILFQLFFVIVGMLISVNVGKIRSVLTYSMALSFGMYILNAIRAIIDSDLMGYFTPFNHFESGYILSKGELNGELVLISCVIIVTGATVTYIRYLKRDIHSL